jgi:hypothetical protein
MRPEHMTAYRSCLTVGVEHVRLTLHSGDARALQLSCQTMRALTRSRGPLSQQNQLFQITRPSVTETTTETAIQSRGKTPNNLIFQD